MIYDNFAPALRLPLSWVQSGTKKIKQRPVLLKGSGLTWLSLVEAPREMPFKKILSILQSRTPSGMIIRGCNNQLADYLHKQNFEICAIGQEAIIDLNKDIFSKKSLKTLVKRGAKHTTIKKVAASPLNQKKLKKLKQQSVHGNKPQLHYLFHDSLKNFTDCFVCENDKKDWIAAITVSYSDSGNAHTELLLRKSSAKTGTMEALIFFIFTYLKNAGYNSWSLGEVPFVNSENVYTTVKSRLLRFTGNIFSFAYNNGTLYNFKNKFSPKWEPVYVCGFPKLSLMSLLEMALKSNYIHLVVRQFLNKAGRVRAGLIKKVFADSRVD